MNTDQKIDAILNKCNDLTVKLEVSIAYQKVQEKRITDHEKKIEVLEASRNISIGKQSILSVLFGSIGAGITLLIKFLSHN